MDLSIIVPLYNEAESLPELAGWIEKICTEKGYTWELIFVDDGSKDGSWEVIESIRKAHEANVETSKHDTPKPHIHAIRFRRNYGKSAALYHGFAKAQGDVVITMDADLQDSPDEIPALYDMVTKEGWDIVSGWKQHRKDNRLTKNIPSKIYNATARAVTGIKLHDMNCGLKAYKNEVVKNIEVYGEMHRYIPYLAKNAGFDKITEKPVVHAKRKYGKSKFGLSRFVHGYLDLLSLWFLSKFSKQPMHFFGTTGSLTFLAGLVIAIILIVKKLIAQSNHLPFRPVADQPLFYLALVALIIGVQLFLIGFIAEMISRGSQNRNNYNISKEF